MRILITGKGGKAGSWKIRAEQLGGAIGADIVPGAGVEACREADLVIVVKRFGSAITDPVRASGTPWVLDLVDGWPQPSHWGRAQAVKWLRGVLKEHKPTAVVFGTSEMLVDSGWRGPSIVLPHHAWPRYEGGAEVRPVKVVGYEGAPHYLGRWQAVVERACAARGLKFHIGDLRQADIGIALRDGDYPTRNWKPGTKLTNMHALGIPALISREAGYRSVSCGWEFWIDSPEDVGPALDKAIEQRDEIREKFLRAAIPLQAVAKDYLRWLKTI